jgi:hypothetical protein
MGGASINYNPKTGGQSALSYRKPFRTDGTHEVFQILTAGVLFSVRP